MIERDKLSFNLSDLIVIQQQTRFGLQATPPLARHSIDEFIPGIRFVSTRSGREVSDDGLLIQH